MYFVQFHYQLFVYFEILSGVVPNQQGKRHVQLHGYET